jgi:hydrogenase maturation protease
MSISSTSRRARIIGLGTPFGDDLAGWHVVERLRQVLPDGTYADTTSDPFVVAYEPMAEELLIVIDACHGAGVPGSVHRFEWPDSRLAIDGAVSSHGTQLPAALELARVLGRLPQQVIVFAIEGESTDPGVGISPAVEAAVPEVVAQVMAELAIR